MSSENIPTLTSYEEDNAPWNEEDNDPVMVTKEVTVSVTYSKTVEMELPHNYDNTDVIYKIRDSVLPPLSTEADKENWIEDDFDFIIE